MNARTFLPSTSLVLLFSAAVVAQDPVKVDPAHYKLLLENASVRILKISYAPGEKSTMHKHPDSLVVSLSDSTVSFATPDGKAAEEKMPSESAMYAPAGTHLPTNVGKVPVDAILVEFKTAKPGTATVPTSRPGLNMTVLAEGPRAMAYRTTADPTFHEPAGSKHDFDQVVIALNAGQMALSIDGKPARTNWKRGDVAFIGRGVAHESQNKGGKPADYVIVAIK